jgi:hypothetical protein
MAKRDVGSPAKYRLEDRSLFIVVPSFVPAGIAAWALHHYGINPTGLLAVVCVMLFNLPFLALIAVYFLYFKEERDEFQTRLLSSSMLWGIGVTLLVTTLWGAMEQFRLVPVMPVSWVLFLFMFFYVVALMVLRWRYR